MEVDEQIKIFRDFIEQNYYPQLLEAVRKGEPYIELDFSELVRFNTEIAKELLEDPQTMLKAGEIAIKEFDLPKKLDRFNMCFSNLPSSQKVNLGNLSSIFFNRLIEVEGFFLKKTSLSTKISSSKFECPSCGNKFVVLQLDQKHKEPSRCGCGRKGKFNLLGSEYEDYFTIFIEDKENYVELEIYLDHLSNGFKNSFKEGDRIKVIGILEPILSKSNDTKVGKKLVANDVTILEIFSEKIAKTEKIDIDLLGGSKITATQRSSLSIMKEIISTLEEQLNTNVIPVENIVELAKEKNIPPEKVEEVLEKLRRSGDIYDVKRGFIRRL